MTDQPLYRDSEEILMHLQGNSTITQLTESDAESRIENRV